MPNVKIQMSNEIQIPNIKTQEEKEVTLSFEI
jgi:hypothetical protein